MTPVSATDAPAHPHHPLSLEWTWQWPTDWEPWYAVHVAALLPLFVALLVAACVDWKIRKIPNWLTFALLGGGLVRSIGSVATGGSFTPLDALLGIACGFAVGLPLFVIGARGAGDAKLYISVGAWVGWPGVVVLAALEAVVGMVVVVGRAAATGQLRQLLSNTGTLLLTFFHLRRVGMEQAEANAKRFTIYGEAADAESRQKFTSIARPLPHAVPFLAAAVLAVLLGRL
jgi:prepilin peptidase CpaA